MLDFGYRPLDLKDNGARTREVVNDLFVQHFYGSVPLASWLSAGLDMPFTWRYSFANPDTTTSDSWWRTSIGDLSVSARAAVFNNDSLGVAVVPFATLPTGDDNHFMGNRGFTGGGKLAFTARDLSDIFTVGINFGAAFRKYVQFSNIDMGSQLLLSGAVKARASKALAFVAEIETATPANNTFRDRNTTPTSARGAVELNKGIVKFAVGAGGGIVHGGGTPLFNVFTMLELAPSLKKHHERTARPPGETAKGATLMFKFASAGISDDAARAAGAVADAAFYDLPGSKLRVIGYADAIGGADYNVRLSKQRAERVARYLELHGIRRDRLKVEWRGGAGGPENRKVTVEIE
jgi:outer membrane protein OmpA-like peptidoglycan-associated protein